jgi:hypothetical protein
MITSYADQRLQSIYYQATASANLTSIFNKYNLYPKARARLPLAEVVADMCDAVTMKGISADVVDPRSGRAGKGEYRLHPFRGQRSGADICPEA